MTPRFARYEEHPVFFPCGQDHMFGVLTRPRGGGHGAVAVFLWGAGGLPSFGKNQLLARLARRAAAEGYHAMRVDYPGIGESSGGVTAHRLDAPLVPEVEATCDWLRAQGLSRSVLVGSCSGARTALAAANRVPGVSGIGMLSPPVLDHTSEEARAIKEALESQAVPEWASRTFLEQLEHALERRMPVLLVYGKGDGLYKDFRRARAGNLGVLLEEAGPLATVRLFEGWVHADPSVEGQDRVVGVLGRWLSHVANAPPSIAAAHA